MIRTILAVAAIALAVSACAPRRDTTNWGAVSIGVGHVLNADRGASNGAALLSPVINQAPEK